MSTTISLESVRNYYLVVTEMANNGTISGSYANNLVESLLADLGIDYEDFMAA